jgi:16S rRNA G1207 methylase RsmC
LLRQTAHTHTRSHTHVHALAHTSTNHLLSACSACLLQSGKTFDWIVSNPPVHDGTDAHFAVVRELARVGPKCLRRGGTLLFVTQTYVPVESLSSKKTKFEEVWTDGRFTVWSYTRAAKADK